MSQRAATQAQAAGNLRSNENANQKTSKRTPTTDKFKESATTFKSMLLMRRNAPKRSFKNSIWVPQRRTQRQRFTYMQYPENFVSEYIF